MQAGPRKAVNVGESVKLATRARVEFLAASGADETTLPHTQDEPYTRINEKRSGHHSLGFSEQIAQDRAIRKPADPEQQGRELDIADTPEFLFHGIGIWVMRVICGMGRHGVL
jgi:hypothetical protein